MAPLFTGLRLGFGRSAEVAAGGSSFLEWGSTSPSSVSWTLTNTLSSQGENRHRKLEILEQPLRWSEPFLDFHKASGSQ